MENALLCQPVIVLRRQVARPQLTTDDRSLLVVLKSQVKDWWNVVLIVKPETVLRWHRGGFKFFWRRKSKGKARNPTDECVAHQVRYATPFGEGPRFLKRLLCLALGTCFLI
jgi:hypothetical protein